MRLLVTGASGWVGSGTVPELLQHGHTVVGLARSERSADAVRAAGAEAVRGDITDLDVLRRAAADSDGVVHLAFRHDIAFSGDYAGAMESDLAALAALGDALEGSGKPLVIPAGITGLRPGEVLSEGDSVPDDAGRRPNELAALRLVDRGVRSVVVRFAPTVHGHGDPGFIAAIVGAARSSGSAAYVGDGANRWCAAHRDDVAVLLRLAVERAPAGSILHGVAEEGVAFRDIAEAIGSGLHVPTESIAADAAGDRFGFLGGVVPVDMPASHAATQALLDWRPSGPTLIEDIERGAYF